MERRHLVVPAAPHPRGPDPFDAIELHDGDFGQRQAQPGDGHMAHAQRQDTAGSEPRGRQHEHRYLDR